MSQEVSVKLDKKLDGLFEKAGKEFKSLRAEYLDEAGDTLLSAVRSNITASGINDAHGHVRAWQRKYMGTGGGYVAVRAVSGPGGKNSPGAITNYLESGHKGRMPSGRSGRYDARIDTGRARAFGFYAHAADAQAKWIAEDTAKKMEEALAGALNGK